MEIISNLYYRTTYAYPFKGMVHAHLGYSYDKMNRTVYRITDLRLWFESDFRYGEELYVYRVSSKGKYNFHKK